jgi:anti-anti-sigma factor
MRHVLEALSSHVKEDANSVMIRFGGGILALTDDHAAVLNRLLRYVSAHAGRRQVILDFSNVTWVSSTGLAVLVALHRMLLDGGGRLVVRDLDDAMHELFGDAGLISVIDDQPSAPAPPQSGPCVLVADDNETVRHLLAGALRRGGFRVVLAASGREAVEQCRKDPAGIAIALLDVNMPGLSGPATLAVLRTICSGLQCFFMTGDPCPDRVKLLQALGAICVFPKPFNASAIVEVLHELTEGAGTPG